MRVVIFTRALGYLNKENEGLFVVQRGKAGLNWVEWSGDVKSAGSKGSMVTAVAFSPYFLNPPLTLRLLAKGDIPHAFFVLLLQPLLPLLNVPPPQLVHNTLLFHFSSEGHIFLGGEGIWSSPSDNSDRL